MQVLILAGGLGTRLGDITREHPKSLVQIQGKPFLQYQLEFLKRNGVTDIVLCIGHLGSQIRDSFGNGKTYGVHIEYSIEDKLLGTAGAIKHAEHLLDNIFFTMYGDSYLSLDFKAIFEYFESQDKQALMTVYKNFNLYDRSNTCVNGNMCTKYRKTNVTEDMIYIDYGVNLLKRTVLDLIPVNQHYSLEKVFPQLIEKNQLLAYEVSNRFYEIGSIKGLAEFKSFVKEAKNDFIPSSN